MRILLPLLALTSCASPSTAPAAPGAMMELRTAVADLNRAYQAADVARLEQLVSADYVHTNSGAAPIGREQWLAWNRTRAERHASGAWSTASYDVSDLRIDELDADTALVTGRVRTAGTRDGVLSQLDLRFTSVWMLRNGAWVRVAFQDAPVPASS